MSLWIERRHENNTSNIFNHNGKIVGHTLQLAFVFGLFHWSVPNQWWGILPPYLFLNINDAPSLPVKKYTLNITQSSITNKSLLWKHNKQWGRRQWRIWKRKRSLVHREELGSFWTRRKESSTSLGNVLLCFFVHTSDPLIITHICTHVYIELKFTSMRVCRVFIFLFLPTVYVCTKKDKTIYRTCDIMLTDRSTKLFDDILFC